MESRDLTFVNGHFYDKKTGKRLKIKNDTDISIATSEGNLLDGDQIGELPEKILAAPEKEFSVKSDPDVKLYKKVFDNGKKLYFYIKRSIPDTKRKLLHEFEVELLEDLYFYTPSDAKKDKGKLFDCACVVRNNVSQSIKMFEEVNGKSLNEVYKNTYVHYFGNIGNPACNAINRFYEEKGKHEETVINRYRKIDSASNN